MASLSALSVMGERRSGQSIRQQNVMAAQSIANIVKFNIISKSFADKPSSQEMVLGIQRLALFTSGGHVGDEIEMYGDDNIYEEHK